MSESKYQNFAKHLSVASFYRSLIHSTHSIIPLNAVLTDAEDNHSSNSGEQYKGCTDAAHTTPMFRSSHVLYIMSN